MPDNRDASPCEAASVTETGHRLSEASAETMHRTAEAGTDTPRQGAETSGDLMRRFSDMITGIGFVNHSRADTGVLAFQNHNWSSPYRSFCLAFFATGTWLRRSTKVNFTLMY
jgi:hypothetical protein